MWWNNTIRNRVMATLEKKVEAAEKAYQNGCDAIDRDAEVRKGTLANELVNSLIGKFV